MLGYRELAFCRHLQSLLRFGPLLCNVHVVQGYAVHSSSCFVLKQPDWTALGLQRHKFGDQLTDNSILRCPRHGCQKHQMHGMCGRF